MQKLRKTKAEKNEIKIGQQGRKTRSLADWLIFMLGLNHAVERGGGRDHCAIFVAICKLLESEGDMGNQGRVIGEDRVAETSRCWR